MLDWIPENVGRIGFVSCLGIAAAALGYRLGFRRFTSINDLPDKLFKRKKVLHGIVSSVGDGDNFQFYHQPLLIHYLRLGIKPSKKKMDGKTFGVRLAGVDAPECGHFGQPAQPFGEEAKEFLRSELTNRRVYIKIYQRDQYSRAVSMVWKPRLLWYENVSLTMVKNGFATIYTSRGAVYGSIKDKILAAEEQAKKKKLKIWSQKASNFESPEDFKRRMKKEK